MKKLILLTIIVLALVFTGCAMLEPQPSVCDKPEAEGSVICDLASTMSTTPEQIDFLFRLGAAVALDRNPDEAGKALMFLDQATSILSGEGITYDALAKYLVGNMPITFVVASELLDKFVGLEDPLGNLLPISDFDMGLLRAHLERQRTLVQLAIGD